MMNCINNQYAMNNCIKRERRKQWYFSFVKSLGKFLILIVVWEKGSAVLLSFALFAVSGCKLVTLSAMKE